MTTAREVEREPVCQHAFVSDRVYCALCSENFTRVLATAQARVTLLESEIHKAAEAAQEDDEEIDQLEAQVATLTHAADEIASAIPPTFYAGADTLFRVVQLVRIWQGAIKANHELEHAAEQARTLHAAQWTRIYALLGWPVEQSVSAEQVVARVKELLVKYGAGHMKACAARRWLIGDSPYGLGAPDPQPDCTCGLASLLTPAPRAPEGA